MSWIVGRKAAALLYEASSASARTSSCFAASIGTLSANSGGRRRPRRKRDADRRQDRARRAFARPDFQSAFAELRTPSDFSHFRDALATSPQVSLVTLCLMPPTSPPAVRGSPPCSTSSPISSGTVMVLGATFAAVNSLGIRWSTRVGAKSPRSGRLVRLDSGFRPRPRRGGRPRAAERPRHRRDPGLGALFNGRQAEVSGVALRPRGDAGPSSLRAGSRRWSSR